jgi:hypothetical protein
MWKIWYGDGSTFSSKDGAPSAAPAWDVQVIVQVDPITGRYNQTGDNYYVWRDTRWCGVDEVGFIDYLANEPPSIVKFGRTIGNEQHRDILRAAEADPDFPSRSGWKPDEKWRIR